MWSRQRQDDTVFLLPEALATKETDLAAVLDGPGVARADKGVIVTMPPGEGSEEEEGSIGGLESWSPGAGYGGVRAECSRAPSVEEVSELQPLCTA